MFVLLSQEQFKEEMLTRKKLLKSKCLTKKSRQVFNHKVFYPLLVIKETNMFHSNHVILSSEKVPCLVPRIQGCLHQLDAQPAPPGGEERGRHSKDNQRSSQVYLEDVDLSSTHQFRQPNEQARIVAPIISKSKLRKLSASVQFKGMLVVRHPFDR